jgi:hypothetical protein
MKYRRHDEVRDEFVRTPQDEAELAAFKEEALDEVRAYRLAGRRGDRWKVEVVDEFGEERLILG